MNGITQPLFKRIMIIVLVFQFCSAKCQLIQKTDQNELDIILKSAGDNREEIENFLNYYRERDSIKYKAAIYMVKNLEYHTHCNVIAYQNNPLTNIVGIADSLYFNLIKGKTFEEIKSKYITDSLKKLNLDIGKILKEQSLENLEIGFEQEDQSPALENITSDFLKSQIENAFRLRDNIEMVEKLNFNNFCEYILPFQSVKGRNISRNGEELNKFFTKYIPTVNKENIPLAVTHLGLTINNLRKILGKYPLEYRLGFEELFFTGVPQWDCFDLSNFETVILNALGIPTATEYNIAYKMLQGKHSQCGILEDVGYYNLFALESAITIPQVKLNSFESYDGWMNIHRKHYSKQKDSPFFLKSEREIIPEDLSSPLIEDITSMRMQTTTITLPFKFNTTNNLAYLGTFNSSNGIIPVTWAKINKKNKSIEFDKIIPDRIYFPVYYIGNSMQSFGDPFIIRIDSTQQNKYVVQKFDSVKRGKKIKSYIFNKYPRKPKMLEVAKDLIGTVVIGSNQSNFKEKDTIYTLDVELIPYLQDLNLNNSTAYKFYRVEAPKEHHRMNLSEVQFLTSNNFNYKNVTAPTPLPILSFENPRKLPDNMVRVLEDSLQKISKWPEYDGKMTTAPSAYGSVTLKLKEPQVITHLRVAPLNEDNGIVLGDNYVLFAWRKNKWKHIETLEADKNFIFNENLSDNELYWLKNLTKGKEELPFFIDKNGKQTFIYLD